MKILWEDGHSIEIPFGQQLVGLRYKGKRPQEILYTPEELLGWPIDKSTKYIQKTIKNAKARN